MPFTTGPGTIAVAIALTSVRPEGHAAFVAFMGGMTLAALVVSAVIWVSYRYADLVIARLGGSGARVVSRLIAFLLLCIGTQIMLDGVLDLVKEITAVR
jgi:multiple antibiotic resistance protein